SRFSTSKIGLLSPSTIPDTLTRNTSSPSA
ncbi:hypothetical protein D031_4514B, partial [Vibrio parahaemolyticus VP-48]